MKIKVLTVGLVLSLMTLSSIIAIAAIEIVDAHGGDGENIHACVNMQTGALRLIRANNDCSRFPANWRPIDWGRVGPPGPPGDSRITGYEIVSDTQVSDNDSHGARAFCPPGKLPIGNGFNVNSDNIDYRTAVNVYRNSPVGSEIDGEPVEGWQVGALWDVGRGDPPSWSLSIWVICADVAPSNLP